MYVNSMFAGWWDLDSESKGMMKELVQGLHHHQALTVVVSAIATDQIT